MHRILPAFLIFALLSHPVLANPDPPALPEKAAAVKDPATVSDTSPPGTYIGNIESMKYHLANCEYAQIMARRRQIKFSTKDQAKMAGMRPCNWCMPSWSMTVQGKVLQQDATIRGAKPY